MEEDDDRGWAAHGRIRLDHRSPAITALGLSGGPASLGEFDWIPRNGSGNHASIRSRATPGHRISLGGMDHDRPGEFTLERTGSDTTRLRR